MIIHSHSRHTIYENNIQSYNIQLSSRTMQLSIRTLNSIHILCYEITKYVQGSSSGAWICKSTSFPGVVGGELDDDRLARVGWGLTRATGGSLHDTRTARARPVIWGLGPPGGVGKSACRRGSPFREAISCATARRECCTLSSAKSAEASRSASRRRSRRNASRARSRWTRWMWYVSSRRPRL